MGAGAGARAPPDPGLRARDPGGLAREPPSRHRGPGEPADQARRTPDNGGRQSTGAVGGPRRDRDSAPDR